MSAVMGPLQGRGLQARESSAPASGPLGVRPSRRHDGGVTDEPVSASDDVWLAQDGNFRQVIPKSAFARLSAYVGGAVLLLLGPAMMIVIAAAGAFEWPTLVGGMAIIVTAGGFAVLSIVSTIRMQRRVERLARTGRPATAEVIAVRPASIGEETGVEATLRVSGPDVPAFEMAHRGTESRVGALGERFAVIVDPADGAYLIVG